MGGVSSSSLESSTNSDPLKHGLGDVPESCVSSILQNLDPQDICKFARLNRAFHGASSADFVWETKLPSNYRFLVEKVLQIGHQYLSKKDIYAILCRPNFFDHGTKQVWMEKCSGKIYVSISYKGMRITGIDDRRYWNHIPSDESRFNTIAYLQQTWWFEVGGELEFEFPPGTYSFFFRLHLGKPSKKFGRRVCNIEQVHGWDIKPVRFLVSTSSGQNVTSECYIKERGKWVYYHVGDFNVENAPSSLIKIKYSMKQIDCTHTKGGICLDSLCICAIEHGDKLRQV